MEVTNAKDLDHWRGAKRNREGQSKRRSEQEQTAARPVCENEGFFEQHDEVRYEENNKQQGAVSPR